MKQKDKQINDLVIDFASLSLEDSEAAVVAAISNYAFKSKHLSDSEFDSRLKWLISEALGVNIVPGEGSYS